mgnify:CR=1 FL=1
MHEWLKVLKLITAPENVKIDVQNTIIATAIPIIMCRNCVFYLRPVLDLMPTFAQNINLVDTLMSTLNTFPMRWVVV